MNMLQLILNAYRNESLTDRAAWHWILDLHIAGHITVKEVRLAQHLLSPR